MKATLQLKFSQHLALTPQLQQSIKLLQLSTVELNQELERFLLENPLLERDETETRIGDEAGSFTALADASLAKSEAADFGASGDVVTTQVATNEDSDRELTYDGADYAEFGEGAANNRLSGASSDDERGDNEAYAQSDESAMSLQQFLFQQLPLTSLSPRDQQMASFIIANLDDDGYLTYEMDDLAALLEANMPEELREQALDAEDIRAELNIALQHVQHLEPTGVGARSLAECLRLQLTALPTNTPQIANALLLVNSHLDVLAQRDLVKLKRLLRVSDEELKIIRALVVSLEPKPGRRFGQGDTRYIIPDVVVKKVRGRWRAMLNQEAMPKLRVNKLYADLLHKSRDADGKNLSGQLQEARWLIKNIQQRFETILKVTEAIVENQRHFFDHGEVAMRPLVLREIAEQVDLHESTVSRVTTQKYMLTPRGIFELKYFFGSSVATEAGGACSATAIRALIKQLVEAEDQRKPLSDNKIADVLSNQGILVARRTVAKYRESLNIAPANLRKSF
jgi:RNA polymerase sigma-54 factor